MENHGENKNCQPVPKGCPRGFFYRARRGDTLAGVARQNALDVKTLLEANPYLNPKRSIEGLTIIIPNSLFCATPCETKEYEVGQNEALFDVLRRFDMSVADLRNMNPDTDVFALKRGMRLRIRAGEESPGYLVMQEGDTLFSIAERMGWESMELLRANPTLRPQEFAPGQKIRIPVTREFTP